MITCPKCHKFVKHLITWINRNDDIDCVVAICIKHGIVNADYDDYEEVAGEDYEPKIPTR